MKIIGGRMNIAIARETTRGQGNLTNMYWLPWTATDFDDKVEKYVSREALGVIDDTADQYITEKWGEGNIEGEVRSNSFGLLLYAALGTWTPAANGAAFDHVFTVAQTNQHTSLSIWFNDPNGDYIFELAMMENLEITLEKGQLATFTAGFVARPSQTTSMTAGIEEIPTKATLASEYKFITTNASVVIANDRAHLAEGTEIFIQNIKVTIAKNLKRKHMLGSTQPDDIINQTISIEGTFTLPYESKIYKDYALQDVYKAMEITLENRAVDLGGGLHPTIVIVLPRVGFDDWTPERPKGELYEQTIHFRGLRDLANAEDLIYTITLTNSVGLTGY